MTLCLAALLYLSWGKNFQCILHALALAVLVPTAPYEVYFIFPINDRVEEIGRGMDRLNKDNEKEERTEREIEEINRELRALLASWGYRNWGRVGPCLVAAMLVGTAGMLGSR